MDDGTRRLIHIASVSMYTKIFDIILLVEFEEDSINNFYFYKRDRFNSPSLKYIIN